MIPLIRIALEGLEELRAPAANEYLRLLVSPLRRDLRGAPLARPKQWSSAT